MRIKMSPLGTKGSILLGDIQDTGDSVELRLSRPVVPPGGRGSWAFLHQLLSVIG